MNEFQTQLDSFFDSWGRINTQYEQYAKRLGLSGTSMKLLYYIYEKKGTCTQTYLCEQTRLPKQTVHSAVQSFVKDGLVSLAENPENRRSKYIALTGAGTALGHEIFETVNRHEQGALYRIPPARRALFVALLREYADNLEKAFG